MSWFEVCSEHADDLRHVVQFCGAGQTLVGNVSGYLLDGLARGSSILVIASAEHNALLATAVQESGLGLDRGAYKHRVLFADAGETLDRFMLDGMPDWRRFQRTVSALLQELRGKPDCGIRAYGEMVSVLWKRGERAAAARLEQFWNRILNANAVQLFCSYPIDVLDREFHPDMVDPLLAEHSHVLSAEGTDAVSTIELAMKTALGADAVEQLEWFRSTGRPAWPMLPETEALILWLRGRLPSHVDEILGQARTHLRTMEPPLNPESVLAAMQ